MTEKATAWPADSVERWPLDKLVPYARNARTHSEGQVAQIAASMREWGWTNPILVDEAGTIIAGHGRIAAARLLGMAEAPVMVARGWTEAQKRAYVLADNKLALNAGWDEDLLRTELQGLDTGEIDLGLIGFSDEELQALLAPIGAGDAGGGAGSLADRFLVPPFSVLNAREGWWQDRKRSWVALGIRSELGRGDEAGGGAPGGSLLPAMKQAGHVQGSKTVRGDSRGKPVNGKAAAKGGYGKCLETGIGQKYGREEVTGTSIFDPVLCEIAYRWFSPVGGTIIDPFAGGSVRGIVATKLGRRYIGQELRGEQVEANRAQALDICAGDEYSPEWIEGDSRTIDRTCAGLQADMLFTCPPYADLEVYSDDPKDLSTLEYPEFRDAYREILAKSAALLRPNSFAVIVVGEVRDGRGNYYDFIGDTVQAMRDAGLEYYNEAILVTAVGSLPIRAGKQFSASRKLGKTHQNVLVFVKGDGKAAAAACGEVDVSVPDEDGAEAPQV